MHMQLKSTWPWVVFGATLFLFAAAAVAKDRGSKSVVQDTDLAVAGHAGLCSIHREQNVSRAERQYAPSPAFNTSTGFNSISSSSSRAICNTTSSSSSGSGGLLSPNSSSSSSSSKRGLWDLDQSKWNPQKAAWLWVVYTIVGLTPSFTGILFDFVYAPLLVEYGLAVRCSDHTIAHSWLRVLWTNIKANSVSTFPITTIASLLHAEFFTPIDVDWSFAPIATLWSTFVMLVLHDTYYYFVHRAMHDHKGLYRAVHAVHHDMSVMMEARTGLVITCAESLLCHCIPYTAALLVNIILFTHMHSGVWCVNIWVLLAPMLVSAQLGMVGHSGLKYKSHLPLLALNPLLFALLFTGTAHSAHDHHIHHERGQCNLALYFRHWDDWCGTSAPAKGRKRAQSSPLLMAYNVAYYAVVTWCIAHRSWLLAAVLSRMGLAVVGSLALVPASCTGWAWLRRLTVWDAVRRAFACTVESQPLLDPQQKYIFAYHPHGLLSRGWWLVFGLMGQESPVSQLRISLALHRIVLSIPLVKHCAGALGCCSADKATLMHKLRQDKQPASIAMIPGGWAEARLAHTNRVLLSKRMGFVRLAMETGAQLVPVLGVGEERIGGAGATMLTAALLLPAKPIPLHVVIGKPLAPQPNESLTAFHARYVAALVDLGQQHGVQLTVV